MMVVHLGHMVSERDVQIDIKITAIKEWPVPTTRTEVRSFCSFTNYYRRFIKGYTKVSKPLYYLTSGKNANAKNKHVDQTEEYSKTFETLKELCVSALILAFEVLASCYNYILIPVLQVWEQSFIKSRIKQIK